VLYKQSIDLHKKKLLEQKGNEIHIPILKLLKSNPLKTIVYEIIKDYGFTPHQTDETIHLLSSESGRYISSSTHKIIKNRNWLIITPLRALEAAHILINETDTKINFEEGELQIKMDDPVVVGFNNPKISSSSFIATLDAKNIIFPLLLRKWKQGDYFYPLGMSGKKKLSKFFIDQKMSLTEKDKIWIVESNKRILWIVGKRIDDRFKVTDKTKKILSIHFNKS
jgi:tRNA(Ile)-lysidine synthase